ncbi:conserved hypothetical protein [Bradyrhizobium sp. ORS 375]|uniref:formyltransferase family protein n=1 Tax=Bradyrhizobium sp. (strain ORS 375) TaxID=566679 RepID=UPI0002405F79|nr:formyltransferase family protein [Bradyrhizobium sp. ORS 375]CCD97069.1 conserved hypothetical protein [Bradyrhizobium sp. ORS 375]
MFDTIILLTGSRDQHLALTALLRAHNPALSFRCVVSLAELEAIERDVLGRSRLLAFTTSVIVPADILAALGHDAYNFHPASTDYPGWAPAHFAIYDGASRFGATAHVMEPRVDCGAIVGVETFDIPGGVDVRGLEQMAFVRLAYLFWRMSRDLACQPGPQPVLPIAWTGIKSTKQMYAEMCDMPADIDAAEMKRRIDAFHDDFRGIPLTVTLHGRRFRLDGAACAAAAPVALDAPARAMAMAMAS